MMNRTIVSYRPVFVSSYLLFFCHCSFETTVTYSIFSPHTFQAAANRPAFLFLHAFKIAMFFLAFFVITFLPGCFFPFILQLHSQVQYAAGRNGEGDLIAFCLAAIKADSVHFIGSLEGIMSIHGACQDLTCYALYCGFC